MPSLRELQQSFADTLFGGDAALSTFALAGSSDGAERLSIYRRAVFANYRNALAASYPVVRQLVGAPFFNTAVDAFVHAHPSTSGDLNIYGGELGAFLAAYPHARELPYLPDVARLEWAIDEANRAGDSNDAGDAVIAAMAAVPPERLPSMRLELDPSCRLVASAFPVLRIWQVHQPGFRGDAHVDFETEDDAILVRRGVDGISLTRLGPGEHAWLAACAAGAALGDAIDAAREADAAFDFASALRAHLAAGTIAGIDID